jgi:hypothetical protein
LGDWPLWQTLASAVRRSTVSLDLLVPWTPFGSMHWHTGSNGILGLSIGDGTYTPTGAWSVGQSNEHTAPLGGSRVRAGTLLKQACSDKGLWRSKRYQAPGTQGARIDHHFCNLSCSLWRKSLTMCGAAPPPIRQPDVTSHSTATSPRADPGIIPADQPRRLCHSKPWHDVIPGAPATGLD